MRLDFKFVRVVIEPHRPSKTEREAIGVEPFALIGMERQTTRGTRLTRMSIPELEKLRDKLDETIATLRREDG